MLVKIKNTSPSQQLEIDVLETHFKDFESLAKAEKWEEIFSQGMVALETARKMERLQDEAKICAQLTSTAFYLGAYIQALVYAHRCHELSERFVDPTLFVRVLYLILTHKSKI